MENALRVRRRAQTAREIHVAALELCQEHGLDAVTTEAISSRAGISLRTFFNYFPNKEAAIVHRPPDFPEAAAKEFAEGNGSLLEDMRGLLVAHLTQIDQNRKAGLLIQALLRDNPGLKNAHEASMRGLISELATILATRLGPDKDHLGDILAVVVICAIKKALDSWLVEEDRLLADSIDEILVNLQQLGLVLQ
ncbi:MAG: TetR/AcrR family transcriptional regulator [Hoeflea sp.]|uniref:TetR/AcrR family transcriptional regulator n=1 Tax=Hoeflea sp. TaxID=1940281 RepID=UPI001DA29EC2|nr:TetR family transcriptional regulator [Hoeflea sp.]MBU4529246.1 TetR/AcrR family transcriptional regulator [Alphaproteobacteria bacterium]MBU4543650.1 TetR/AcrR family transcriptional regulator [Alphaproteobacteria bacterium]MBU4549276.1 TetR/AcrR family transcriptional regulator [Alphaproteobacteria bacterium]MBV1725409.1 TetR/AcrR family transcriptional regulator [Hoeflea sp.]MBV1785372.1 TetR/AcrR family transcriptional regulator [Hoeflea sp.]